MTKTNQIKVSTIRPENQEKPGKEKHSQAKASTAGDAFVAGSTDDYQGLVEGKPKASDLGGSNRSTLPQDRIQTILGNLMGLMGDNPDGPSADDFETPHVPDLQGEILKVAPKQYKNMKPVVQRYAGLKRVIRTLIEKADDTLRNNGWQMSTGEKKALRAHCKQLEQALWKCQEQLDLARKYYRWQIQREEMED